MKEEIWDLYDALGQKTSQTQIRNQNIPDGRYHMVVGCFIFNEQHELLIQKRHPQKVGWPGLWDLCSACGSALTGEDARQAITREVREELGLSLDFSQARPIFTAYGSNYFTHYFIMRTTAKIQDLKLQADEVVAAQFVNHQQLNDMIQQKICIPYELISDHIFDLNHINGLQIHFEKSINQEIQIFKLCPSDLLNCLALFQNTVYQINRHDYTQEQIKVWVDPMRSHEDWIASFQNHEGFVAKINQEIVGFIDMDDTGYLDRLYVSASYQGYGIGKKLVNAVYQIAQQKNLKKITTYASITAKPFFEHLGFSTIQKQTVWRHNVALTNFQMIKCLTNQL